MPNGLKSLAGGKNAQVNGSASALPSVFGSTCDSSHLPFGEAARCIAGGRQIIIDVSAERQGVAFSEACATFSRTHFLEPGTHVAHVGYTF
jgi:hypothetical protein